MKNLDTQKPAVFILKFEQYDFVIRYHNDPKFSDRYAWANSADPNQIEEQSDQGLHGLPFRLHHLDSLLYGRAT